MMSWLFWFDEKCIWIYSKRQKLREAGYGPVNVKLILDVVVVRSRKRSLLSDVVSKEINVPIYCSYVRS